jgi:predicted ribosome quality control (RQC) complex YloA/Tae2 family protein
MRLKKYSQFNESKKKEFNFQRMEIEGFLVYRGRDAKSNDHLVLHIADSDDIWLHVIGYKGCHMLIKVKDKIPTLDVIKKVAQIAKDNSDAKDLDNIKVVYCKAKFVKKENHHKVGEVSRDKINSHEVTI